MAISQMLIALNIDHIRDGQVQVNVNVPATVSLGGERKGEARPDSPLNLLGIPTGRVEVRGWRRLAMSLPSRRRRFRGGSWDNGPRDVRAANRDGYALANRNDKLGFRLAGTP